MSKLIALLFIVPLFAATPPKPVKKADIVASISPSDMTRALTYSEREIPTIQTQLHYTTVFVLPKDEKVMDLVCGNTEEWTINGADGTNFAYIKPEKAGARTNLNLVTASGNVYSFLLVEDSERAPNLKVFVNTKDAAMLASLAAPPKWVSASEAETKLKAAKDDVARANSNAAAAQAESDRKINEVQSRAEADLASFRSGFPSSLKHDYTITNERKNASFGVHAIAHSKDFTYIWANPQETPALYELKDGKPSLIQFQYDNGVYVVGKVMDQGYLAIGKKRLIFKKNGGE